MPESVHAPNRAARAAASDDAVDRPEWTVLASGDARHAKQAPSSWRVVAPVIVAAIAVAAVVGVAGSLVSKRIAEQQAVHDVAQMTDLLAESVVQPALTDRMPTNDELAVRVLDPVVRKGVLSSSLVRVKLWTAGGRIVYSDDSRLVGDVFALEPDARSAITSPRTEAGISDLSRPENRFERNQGRLLEVYRPVWTPDGTPLLFETYFRYDTVSARSAQLWRGFSGIMISSVAALFVLLVPIVGLLLARARRARLQREHLMRHALEASDDERRRIAASLHDGVVQQLAGAAFAAAGHAERAERAGDPQRATELRALADAVRDGVTGLRSLLVDIYPPSLHTAGLSVALRDLARTRAEAAPVSVEIDESAADALPLEAQQAVYRIAQEALRNAARHAGAAHVALRLASSSNCSTVLEIADDGRGFDLAAARASEGHFGLELMSDAARRAGAALAVAGGVGAGTRIRLEVPSS